MTDGIPHVDGYIGGHLRAFRQAHGLTQQRAGELMGFPAASAQSSYSNRESLPDNPRYSVTSIVELAQLEDGVGVPRGTILRSAGLVVCPGDADPVDVVASWIWLNEAERSVIEMLIAKAMSRLEADGLPTPAPRRRKIR